MPGFSVISEDRVEPVRLDAGSTLNPMEPEDGA